MKQRSRLKGAIAACWKAAIFSGGPFLLLTLPLGAYLTGDCPTNPRMCVTGPLLMIGPLLIAFLTIVAGFLLIGFPVSQRLERSGRATPGNLGWIGGITGGLLMLAFTLLADGYWPAVLLPSGIIGGAIAGHQWGEVLARDHAERTSVPR